MNADAAVLPTRIGLSEFLAFVHARPDDEKWELVDGTPRMMNPPTRAHQTVAMNFAFELNLVLREQRSPLLALVEVGLSVDSRPDFLPQADVALVSDTSSHQTHVADFRLVAEVISASNTRHQIARKRDLYMEHPDNLYVIVFAQRELRVEVWSRAANGKGLVLLSSDDVLELPEFGFRCALRDLYRGTPLA